MVLSAVRVLGADVTDPMALAQRIADLGQPLYGKAEPTGYSTISDAWSNSAGFLGRINFAGALAAGQMLLRRLNNEEIGARVVSSPILLEVRESTS